MDSSFCPPQECKHHETLWFEDGSIVLQTGKTIFCVHRSILAARCSVFKDMLAFPVPPSGTDAYDGLPLVRLHDDEEEMGWFILAIFDST